MERAKKMVLISTDNLERMRQMGHSTTSSSSTTTTTNPSVSTDSAARGESAENKDNTVRTPGTVLSRLDGEMHRILNSPILGGAREKWRLYREVLQRYLHFFRERERRRARGGNNNGAGGDGDDGDEENARPDDEDHAREEEEGGNENVDVEDIPDLQTDAGVFPHERAVGSHHHHHHHHRAQKKSIGKILSSVPKSYRAKARKLLSHLCDVALPARLSWDRRGVVTIDGRILRGSNIVELLNDAARERKTVRPVARARFARLLRDVDTPAEFVGNPELLKDNIEKNDIEESEDFSSGLNEAVPRATSTPIPSQPSGQPSSKRAIGETSFETQRDHENSRAQALFVFTNQGKNKTRVSGGVSKSTNKRRMTNWNPLELSSASSSPGDAAGVRTSLPNARARKRKIGETSLSLGKLRGCSWRTSDVYNFRTVSA